MKKVILLAMLIFSVTVFSQVGINTTDPNAQLDVRSSNQVAPSNTDGIIIPKIDAFPAVNPTALQQSMLVYLTTTSGTNSPGFYYWDNATTSWISINGKPSWNLTGNAGTDSSVNFIGTTDNKDVVFKRNGVRSGIIAASNTSFGVNALNPAAANTGINNIAMGSSALIANTVGNRNVALGNVALASNQSGSSNIAAGFEALNANIGGNSNVALGNTALKANTNGNNNVAIGSGALTLNNGTSGLTGSANIAIGTSALSRNTTGNGNLSAGFSTLFNNTTGGFNVSLGYNALFTNTTGGNNIAIGRDVLRLNNTGSDNIATGFEALKSSTGNGNVVSGYRALHSITSGSNNTGIGYNVNATIANPDNSIALGNNASITASNQVRIGNSAITTIGGFQDWTNVSDRRFKKNIISNVPGLDFIKKLRPVTYHMDMDAIARTLKTPDSLRDKKAEQLKASVLQTGFIAQEVEKAALDSNFEFSGVDKPKNENDYYGLRYAEFVVPLVKAVQEQQEIIVREQEKNKQLQATVKLLEDRLKAIEDKLNK